MKRIIGLLALGSIFLSSQTFGQEASCAQTLRLVQSTYEQGRLHELEALMTRCLASGFDDQQKVTAYRYLTLAYIYLEEPEKADAAMLSLLSAGQPGHFFEPNDAVDPAEFIALYRKFRTEPLFRFGLKLGPNATLPSITQTYYVFSGAQGNGKYSPKVNFSFGLVFEKDFPKFIKNFSIAPEVMFTGRSYNYTNPSLSSKDFVDPTDPNPNSQSIDQNLQKQSWIDVNPLVQYKLKDIKFNPYVGVGPGVSYLLKSTYDVRTQVTGQGAITGSAIDTKSNYNALAYSVILTTGAKIRVGSFYLTGDIRYQYGLNNIVKSSERSNSEALFDRGYVPSDYRQSNLIIYLGMAIPYFSPKKLVK